MRTKTTVALLAAVCMVTMGLAPTAGALDTENEAKTSVEERYAAYDGTPIEEIENLDVIYNEDGTVDLVMDVPTRDGPRDLAQAEASDSCGGIAPLQISCSGGAGIDTDTKFQIYIARGIEFQGIVENHGEAFHPLFGQTGEWDLNCFFVSIFTIGCSQFSSSGFVVIDGAGYYQYRGGSDILSTGTWEIGVND